MPSASQQGHSQRVNDLAFNAAGSLLYSCGDDRNVMVWSMASGELVSSFRAARQAVSRLALSPDGSRLLTASTSLKLWDTSTLTQLALFQAAHVGQPSALYELLELFHGQTLDLHHSRECRVNRRNNSNPAPLSASLEKPILP